MPPPVFVHPPAFISWRDRNTWYLYNGETSGSDFLRDVFAVRRERFEEELNHVLRVSQRLLLCIPNSDASGKDRHRDSEGALRFRL
jgi:hypothetical protein